MPQSAQREKEILLVEADQYLQGHYNILNVDFKAHVIDWHHDPQSGKRSPLKFGLNLNYRDYSVTGNVKNIWEINRHSHLTVLALAYALTKNETYAGEIERQLRSWVDANPFLYGVNWSSTLELGIRLINWVWIERLIRGSDSHENLFGANGLLWSTAYRHQWLIARFESRGSSSNNHLVGEMAGLFIGSIVWPYFPESKEWQASSRSVLEKEVSRQIFACGLNREQAFSYHIFSMELFLLAGLEASRSGEPFTAGYANSIRRMFDVIPLLTDAGGNLPRFGDADEGLAVQSRPKDSSRIDMLYRIASEWPGINCPTPQTGSGILGANVIWPTDVPAKSGTYNPSPNSINFDEAGIFLLTSQRGTSQEVFCLADAGPLGFLSLAAHGHADALSFTLNIGGKQIIIDPGTFSYFLDPSWRHYFRSTKAHNTIIIDGEDQSVSGGPFLWTRKAQTRVLKWSPMENGAELTAEHLGYMRLKGRPIHRRRWTLDEDQLEIYDEILGSGIHEFEWRLHFDPECNVIYESNECTVYWDSGELNLTLDSSLNWSLESGQAESGWYSPKFNIKVPTVTLIGLRSSALPIILTNTIKFISKHIDHP